MAITSTSLPHCRGVEGGGAKRRFLSATMHLLVSEVEFLRPMRTRIPALATYWHAQAMPTCHYVAKSERMRWQHPIILTPAACISAAIIKNVSWGNLWVVPSRGVLPQTHGAARANTTL